MKTFAVLDPETGAQKKGAKPIQTYNLVDAKTNKPVDAKPYRTAVKAPKENAA